MVNRHTHFWFLKIALAKRSREYLHLLISKILMVDLGDTRKLTSSRQYARIPPYL